MEFIAKSPQVEKVSKRDLPIVIGTKKNGATTVSGTMAVASMVGIKVFVTGGIGGVHRGANSTFDISADLEELANTDVIVVCAGAKSILDIGLTLEYLETKAVPVLGFQTDEFPAFYSRKSNYPVQYSVENILELASIVQAKWDLNVSGGMVIANPIDEQFEIPLEEIEPFIQEALKEADLSKPQS